MMKLHRKYVTDKPLCSGLEQNKINGPALLAPIEVKKQCTYQKKANTNICFLDTKWKLANNTSKGR